MLLSEAQPLKQYFSKSLTSQRLPLPEGYPLRGCLPQRVVVSEAPPLKGFPSQRLPPLRGLASQGPPCTAPFLHKHRLPRPPLHSIFPAGNELCKALKEHPPQAPKSSSRKCGGKAWVDPPQGFKTHTEKHQEKAWNAHPSGVQRPLKMSSARPLESTHQGSKKQSNIAHPRCSKLHRKSPENA